MERDIFRRGVRMVHKFGETEKQNDPLQTNTFDFQAAQERTRVRDLSGHTGPCTVKEYGETRSWAPPRSPVQKPNGQLASTEGPTHDMADEVASVYPTSTKKRVDHKSTDK